MYCYTHVFQSCNVLFNPTKIILRLRSIKKGQILILRVSSLLPTLLDWPPIIPSLPFYKMPNGARHYAFTLNNYTDDDIFSLASSVESGSVSYLIFGKETSSSGTPHLQVYVYFGKRLSIKQAKVCLAIQAHFTVARDIPRSIEYCKKDGDFTEFGVSPTYSFSQGRRTDLQSFRDAVAGGSTDLPYLRETFPSVMAQYPRFAIFVICDLRPKIQVPTYDLHYWQTKLVELLSQAPSSRQIHFLVDKTGNAGKTYIADFLESFHEKVQVMKPGKVADMAYEYDEDTKVLIVDVPRSKTDKIEYMYTPNYK